MDDRLETPTPLGGPGPDIMNDPQYATNTADGGDSIGDPDTCRICRGEGSDQEPLFHPCKCSGSIKYVHQDCLMEWLSHSQKKHCELCKTPFRFTKLYSPNMPQSLPIHVLARHVVIHSVRNLATWLRFCLVVTVWLGCLPYIIRQVWRLLFWFSDGGWPSKFLTIDPSRNSTAIQALEIARQLQLASLTGNGTSPVTPLHASQTTSASVGGMMDKLMGFLMPFSQTLNISGSDPLAAGLFKSLYYGFGIQSVVIPEGPLNNTNASQFFLNLSPTRTPSLLSDVPFLKNMTRHTYVNQLIITIAEGYIITILVVVCFILVFLIREWVVQQQPGINMGAGFNAGLAVVDRPRDEQVQAEIAGGAAGGAADRNPADGPLEPREIGQRPMARPRRRNVQFEATNDLPVPASEQERDNARQEQSLAEAREPADSSSQTRPAPVRDALSPAAEIQRRLTEEPRMTEEFLAIWRRSDGDPREVLRIIERENRGDQMRYWVNAMKILQNPVPQTGNHESRPAFLGISSPSDPHDTLPVPLGTDPAPVISTAESTGQVDSDRSSASSESWVDVPKALQVRKQNMHEDGNDAESKLVDEEEQPLDKGKGKAREDSPEPLFDPATDLLPGISLPKWDAQSGNPWKIRSTESPSLPSSNARPRAISDGPQPRENISPLANNNWTFSNLPEDENANDQKSSSGNENKRPSIRLNLPSSGGSKAPKLNIPESSSQGSQAWKAAQDLRVQQAIAKGREAHKSAMSSPIPLLPTPSSPSEFEGPIQIQVQDGMIRDAQNWDEVFDKNPVPESNEEAEIEENHEAPAPNPFQPAIPLPEGREPVVVQPAEPRGIVDHVADWLWGGVGDDRQQDEQGGNDEHIVEDLDAEAPFVPVAHHDLFDQGGDGLAGQDPEVLEAAIAAGLDPNDPDAIDDAEDFEGIMELVGMRGPLFSLVQNALFSAFLLALTVAFGVWIPYNIGRVSLLLTANPGPAFKLPLRLVFGFAALLQDLALSIIGVVSYCFIAIFSLPLKLWSYYAGPINAEKGIGLGLAALQLSANALDRIMDGTVSSLIHITDSEIFAFSAASHESLIIIKTLLIDTLTGIGSTVVYLFVGDYEVSRTGTWSAVSALFEAGKHQLTALPAFLARPDSWVISLELAKRSSPLNLELSVWEGMDRFWATVAGYTALSLLGALYVRKGSPFSSSQIGREWEATIIDLLNQAGGVMKVILIISIEMLVFPLYCGLLLDAALLPLFENATITSRILFTVKSPLTSIFVHWFVGTCYMFHFALFVSMCRKIMRKGVLCKFPRAFSLANANHFRLHPRP